MSDTIDAIPFPVTLTPGFTTDGEKTLEVSCHDRVFKNVTVFNATDREEVFRVSGKGVMSWSFRRSLKDHNEKHILDFRHHSLDVKNRWVVEDPQEKKLATIEHVNQITKSHSAVDAVVYGAHDGRDVTVEMRPVDRAALTTNVNIKGATVAQISMIGDNDIQFNEARGKDRSVWRVRVASGVDLSLITVMVLCRAEMAHVWRQ